ncbi:hypothetical protein B0O99DRAFT_608539 [Bisporella sp. PMI_857]|nr:hypothetical protein B0O99DRAFT_608539 [Bisporella sp. PMI_857]
MKKMFGEKGWLGSSADENFTPPRDSKTPTKKSSTPSKNAHGGQKKTTMIEKLKNKFEEFAEKAELNTSPKRGSRERNAKLSLLDVSISPPDQANIAMETELMLVHTANTFLMNQFKKGRFRVETIKRTVDTWTSKGRPLVIEFMYDQITQHSLVAANLSTFRFHGPRAADEIRISSMLYNWKQVANLMAIRTFCNGDTVLLKLLFDIEQILELLGADEPRMLQLQQIRAAAHEMIRVVRSAKEENLASQSGGGAMGRVGWNAYLASEALSNGGGLVGGGSYVGLF